MRKRRRGAWVIYSYKNGKKVGGIAFFFKPEKKARKWRSLGRGPRTLRAIQIRHDRSFGSAEYGTRSGRSCLCMEKMKLIIKQNSKPKQNHTKFSKIIQWVGIRMELNIHLLEPFRCNEQEMLRCFNIADTDVQ